MKRYNKGFTLLELMITLAIVSIVVMMGVPSFQSTIKNSRLTAAINELSAAINMARSEAIKRNKNVIVCHEGTYDTAASSSVPCGTSTITGGDWRDGWQVFVDVDRSTAAKTDAFNDDGDATLCEPTEDCVLKVQEALAPDMTLRPSGTSFDGYVRYTPTGVSSPAVGVSFYLCSPDSGTSPPPANTAKVLILNAVGHSRMAVDSNKNGIPEKPTRTDIPTCAP